jgi:mono/diheme cytochrome c family protein
MPDAGETSDTGTLVSFSKQIFPILEANCVRCHGPSRQNNGVRVDSYTEVKSRLSMVTHALVDGLMPPSGALPLANRQLFQAWVDEGALDN